MMNRLNFTSAKGRTLSGLLLLFCVSGICLAFSVTGDADFSTARREILLRKIGHEILLTSGDSTSLVLPIQKTGSETYRIRFGKEFAFNPEELMETTRRLLSRDPASEDHVINVRACGNTEVVYGFALSAQKTDDITACTGRLQPKACYEIDVRFKPSGIGLEKAGYLFGSLSLLAFAGAIFLKSGKIKKAISDKTDTESVGIGTMLFDLKNRKLRSGGKVIELTGTEARLLRIFASAPNQTIERNRLQKEIWEDEGVIVGRSLDMFISKLRKKLETDPDVKIVVVRGIGYRLEIGM